MFSFEDYRISTFFPCSIFLPRTGCFLRSHTLERAADPGFAWQETRPWTVVTQDGFTLTWQKWFGKEFKERSPWAVLGKEKNIGSLNKQCYWKEGTDAKLKKHQGHLHSNCNLAFAQPEEGCSSEQRGSLSGSREKLSPAVWTGGSHRETHALSPPGTCLVLALTVPWNPLRPGHTRMTGPSCIFLGFWAIFVEVTLSFVFW